MDVIIQCIYTEVDLFYGGNVLITRCGVLATNGGLFLLYAYGVNNVNLLNVLPEKNVVA